MIHPRRSRRSGFTLIETVVTVGLLAVLAAFVVPSVIQKAGAGDPVKVQNDLTVIGTAIETFANDTKGKLPNQIYILTSRPATHFHLIDSTTTITAADSEVWNGPYIALTTDTIPTDSVATGFTAYIKNLIQRYDVATNKGEFTGGTGASFSTADQLFAAVQVDGLTTAQAAAINAAFDGANDPNVASGPTLGANTTGRFRFDAPVNGIVTAYFMAVPITQ